LRCAPCADARYAQGMDGQISRDATAATLVTAALEGTLTDAQDEQLAALDLRWGSLPDWRRPNASPNKTDASPN